MKRLYVLSILFVNLVFLAWAPCTVAVTTLQSFTLQEYGLYPRSGAWDIYGWPGNPWGFGNLGAVFSVDPVCSPSSTGGIFLSEGWGYGYLGWISDWPFPQGTVVNGIDLCDPNADMALWFYYGDSLNLVYPRADRYKSFWGEDERIISNTCATTTVPTDGVFFLALRRTSQQLPDASCPGGLGGSTPIRVGNALICTLDLPWVSALGTWNAPFYINSCEWYSTCSNLPIGGVGPGISCASGGGGGGGGGNGAVAVTVNNASTAQPISGAAVNYPGGPTQTTDANGKTTFNSVPAGSSITFTASATDFATGSGAVTPVANTTTPLAISLAPVVACSTSQVAGADTPDTRFVNLNKNSGTFVFDYETYTQQDRIIVSYEGRVLFDTGCVGANGSESLSFSGSATGVTVEVQPNCAGGTGTAWNYFVHCPN